MQLELIRFVASVKPFIAASKVSERIITIIQSILLAAVPAQELAVMESMQVALETIVSAVFDGSNEFGGSFSETQIALCRIFEGLLQQLLSLKWTEPKLVVVLGHYFDALGPFLKYFPDAVGSVINKLFELLTSLPFVLKDPSTSISRHARLQICTSFIRIAKAVDKSLLPHMKEVLRNAVKKFKHAYAVRMNIGDHDFVNVSSAVSNMLSPKFEASFTAANSLEMSTCLYQYIMSGTTMTRPCHRNNDDSASASPSDNSSSVNRRWDSVIQEVLRNAVKNAVSNMLSPKFAASFTAASFLKSFGHGFESTLLYNGSEILSYVNSQCAVLWTSSLGDQYAAIVNAQEEGPCHALHSVDSRTICQLVAQKLEGPNLGMLAAANDPRKGGLFATLLNSAPFATDGALASGVHHALNVDPYSGVFGSDREKYARDVEDLITFGTSGHVAGFISEAIQNRVDVMDNIRIGDDVMDDIIE
ncbi:hypothetical protein TEA_029225 [Camellia sinensis var. sinensis]|uniref:Exportin-5 C-terminal domain-containing protein n=1 Tax=Camellia sinensis var. sinensis TaxID=542762 RepID=A0A4S4E960_CAMSN|nr:hypothetical protein TEA_029225 [Camellia sinensis var. sinensis]